MRANRTVRMRSVALCLAAALALCIGAPSRTRADLLNPNDFASLGTLSISSSAYPGYDIETSSGTPVLTNAAGSILFTGVVKDGVAVFDFNSINITGRGGLTINAIASAPSTSEILAASKSLPVALLSRNDINVAGFGIGVAATSVSGPGTGGSGQFSLPSGPGSYGLGPLFGGSGGGGFGTQGTNGQTLTGPTEVHYSPSSAVGGAGGSTYGDLTKQLQMGSPGGPGLSQYPFPSINYGGGAVELGANGTINITSSISADGASGLPYSLNYGAGGGSGGAILIHANVVNLSNPSDLSVAGGLGSQRGSVEGFEVPGYGAGGNGGEGRITIVTAASVPEPSSLALSAVVALVGLGMAWRKHARAKA